MDKLAKVIQTIREETLLDVEIYNRQGDRVATTVDLPLRKITPEYGQLSNGDIVQDAENNMTVFAVNVLGENLVGVLNGADEVTRNYGLLLARLIESNMAGLEKMNDRSSDIRLLLSGDMNRTQQEQFAAKYGDETGYYVLVFECEERKAVFDYLKDLVPETDIVLTMTKKSVVLIKDATGLEEYQSPSDFAHMVAENAEQEAGIKLNVGIGDNAVGLIACVNSYHQALSALRFGKLLDAKARIYNTKDYFLVSLFEEMSKDRIRSFLLSGIDKGLKSIFEDSEMMDTAEQFMLGSLNISETARNMYMHRNTLIYRLDKIEKATGLNIRRFSDAMTFRTLSMLYKLNKKELK